MQAASSHPVLVVTGKGVLGSLPERMKVLFLEYLMLPVVVASAPVRFVAGSDGLPKKAIGIP